MQEDPKERNEWLDRVGAVNRNRYRTHHIEDIKFEHRFQTKIFIKKNPWEKIKSVTIRFGKCKSREFRSSLRKESGTKKLFAELLSGFKSTLTSGATPGPGGQNPNNSNDAQE